jgi:hypothetical protein
MKREERKKKEFFHTKAKTFESAPKSDSHLNERKEKREEGKNERKEKREEGRGKKGRGGTNKRRGKREKRKRGY